MARPWFGHTEWLAWSEQTQKENDRYRREIRALQSSERQRIKELSELRLEHHMCKSDMKKQAASLAATRIQMRELQDRRALDERCQSTDKLTRGMSAMRNRIVELDHELKSERRSHQEFRASAEKDLESRLAEKSDGLVKQMSTLGALLQKRDKQIMNLTGRIEKYQKKEQRVAETLEKQLARSRCIEEEALAEAGRLKAELTKLRAAPKEGGPCCYICLGQLLDGGCMLFRSCGHAGACRRCILELVQTRGSCECPICRAPGEAVEILLVSPED